MYRKPTIFALALALTCALNACSQSIYIPATDRVKPTPTPTATPSPSPV